MVLTAGTRHARVRGDGGALFFLLLLSIRRVHTDRIAGTAGRRWCVFPGSPLRLDALHARVGWGTRGCGRGTGTDTGDCRSGGGTRSGTKGWTNGRMKQSNSKSGGRAGERHCRSPERIYRDVLFGHPMRDAMRGITPPDDRPCAGGCTRAKARFSSWRRAGARGRGRFRGAGRSGARGA